MVADSSVTGHDKILLSSSSSSPSPSPLSGQQPQAAPQSNRLGTWATEDCDIITDTVLKLERCGFYWGPLGVEDAHRMLRDAPLGSYLIRDSRQKDVFFTLSYHAKAGPVSVRITYSRQKFALAGNDRTFPTLFALLEYYASSPKKSLRAPYRKWQPTLQELCRKRIISITGGRGRISELPLTRVTQDFLSEFPYTL
uniref:Suppressor of cytokine signaling 1 variant 2 n=1 Tax=Tetraodon nigroviridis TaxID=99883 RepID=A9Q0R3_TETNG|nr:suppressor of cytokine signaling 1 variant 2 [Tetraodon nigroviridis]